MIRINLITVGKLKEKYWRDAAAEYSKRLGAFCKLEIVELNESRLSDNPSEKEIAAALENEAKAMKSYTDIKGAYNIAMCIEGKQLSSEKLSKKLSECGLNGFSTVNFIIGSSFGIAPEIKAKADLRLSMSEMTFPHQLARIMLLEQVYRAFQISANTRYHKEKNSLLIYSILYQDGIIHSLKRILARQETGEYMNPEFINNSIYSYYYLFDKYMKQNRIFDAAYLLGYAHAMDFILYEYFQVSKGKKINSDNTICLYYLPRKKVYNNMNEFNKDINEFKTKKYINLANRIAEEFGGPDSGLEVHHIPFI